MTRMMWIRNTLEYLGGALDTPPPGFRVGLRHWWFWGAWWGFMAVLAFAFAGQTSKFIYIDF